MSRSWPRWNPEAGPCRSTRNSVEAEASRSPGREIETRFLLDTEPARQRTVPDRQYRIADPEKFLFTVCSDRENISSGCQGCVSIARCMREGDFDRLVEHGPVMKIGAPSAQSSHLESSVPSSAALIARQQIGWQPWRLAFPLQERGSAVPADVRPQRSRSCRRVTIPA